MFHSLRFQGVTAVLCLAVLPLSAQEWTRFRGPNGSGVSASILPVNWTEKDYAWKVKLPAPGHSSPVLWGERLFVTSGDEAGKLHIVCLAAPTGQQLWAQQVPIGKHRQHADNNLAAATPALDARHIYLAWGNPRELVVLALTHEGKEVWRRDLGPCRSSHGFASSPIVHAGMVIMPCEQNGKDGLAGLDSATGEVRWRVARKSRNTYATPCIYQVQGRLAELIAVSYEDGITSLDPMTGRLHWAVDIFDKQHVECAIASPITHRDLILGTAGWLSVRYETIAVRPQTTKKLETVYRLERGAPLVPTPLVTGDLLFLVHDRGVVRCTNANTGVEYYRERVPGTYYASPVCAGRHLYCVSREGDVVVLAAAEKFEHAATIRLGEGSHATPAIAGGRIYFRTFTQLFCLEAKK